MNHSRISSWKYRPFDKFFMGQSDHRKGYKMRTILLNSYRNQSMNGHNYSMGSVYVYDDKTFLPHQRSGV